MRDVVEIVAIVLAGVWAFYTFVYNDRIKPNESPPTLVVGVTLEPVGAKGDLRAIKLTSTYRNTGTIAFRFLGFAETVLGERVVAGNPQMLKRPNDADVEFSFARGVERAQSEVAFTFAKRFHGAGGATNDAFDLDPGETSTSESIFYVPRTRYDALLFVGDYRITKDLTSTIPITIEKSKDGRLSTAFGDPACKVPSATTCQTVEDSTSTTLSLW